MGNTAEKSKSREEQLAEVREHIQAASSILQTLSPELARVAWMLEDSLSFIDEAEAEKENTKSAHTSTDVTLDELEELVSSSGTTES